MPTLLDRSKTLLDHVAELDQIGVARTTFEILRTRSGQMTDRANDLSNVVKSIKLLEAHGVVITPIGPSKELARKSAKALEDFDKDWASITNDDQIVITFLTPIQSYAAKLRQIAVAAWHAHLDNAAPKITDAALPALGRVLGAEIERLRDLRDSLARLRQTLPANKQTFTELSTITTAITKIWSKLEGVPNPVRRFLVKAGQKEAKFADLTPEVKKWLEENSILEQLRIGFAQK